MRKVLMICLLAVAAWGCNVTQHFEPKFSMGMSQQEFTNANRSAVRVYGDQYDVIIYRTENGITETFKFFRFSKDKLVQFGEGKHPDDYKLLLRY